MGKEKLVELVRLDNVILQDLRHHLESKILSSSVIPLGDDARSRIKIVIFDLKFSILAKALRKKRLNLFLHRSIGRCGTSQRWHSKQALFALDEENLSFALVILHNHRERSIGELARPKTNSFNSEKNQH